ncbi:hypothetical protein J2TS4_31710 [Paenibacillus sp. J2TS4]|nr:hypothetical protein J2TS4_31710 [Paenibacillus sp. J2TS4]
MSMAALTLASAEDGNGGYGQSNQDNPLSKGVHDSLSFRKTADVGARDNGESVEQIFLYIYRHPKKAKSFIFFAKIQN